MLREILINRGLSERESQVCELAARGLPTREIGEKLFICEKSVKYHLTNIYKKLETVLIPGSYQKRAGLMLWAADYLKDQGETHVQQSEAEVKKSDISHS